MKTAEWNLLSIVFVVCLFSGTFASAAHAVSSLAQPADERAAQEKLPHAESPVWVKFLTSKIHYDNRSGLYSIALTPAVKDMAGRPVTLNGFVLPLDANDHTSHFLLTRNTPVCMFCPPGQPNEVVEVFAPHPVLWTDNIITVTGPLKLINNGEKGMFFQINATAVR